MAKEQLLLLFSLPIYVIVIGAEFLFSHFGDKKWYNIKESFMNLYLTILNMLLDIAMRGITLVVFAWATSYKLYHWESKNWLYWLSLGIGVDFFYYWLHRLDHTSRLFWAVHVTHHSAIEYNITTGFRSSVFEPLYRFIFYIPLPFLGFSALDILFIHSLLQIYGVFIHTRAIKKLPALVEYIFVTPSHHRVHHGSNILYLDKNMAMTLIIWDRIFGTFQAELEAEPVVYGLTKNPEDRGYVNMVLHEWQAIWEDVRQPNLTMTQRINYIIKAPGWSHNGSRKTTEQLRKDLKG
jgi:sterol desaturase/sphingolipid hydroxylase (fatty acid hydroxylase superfamily)